MAARHTLNVQSLTAFDLMTGNGGAKLACTLPAKPSSDHIGVHTMRTAHNAQLPVAIPAKKWRFIVLDNGGETADRYTVFYKSNGWQPWQDYFALSAYPDHPQGISQCGEVTESGFPLAADKFRDWLASYTANGDRRIRFSDLPENVQAHVYRRLADGEEWNPCKCGYSMPKGITTCVKCGNAILST